jgi:hypothetical protein
VSYKDDEGRRSALKILRGRSIRQPFAESPRTEGVIPARGIDQYNQKPKGQITISLGLFLK